MTKLYSGSGLKSLANKQTNMKCNEILGNNTCNRNVTFEREAKENV